MAQNKDQIIDSIDRFHSDSMNGASTQSDEIHLEEMQEIAEHLNGLISAFEEEIQSRKAAEQDDEESEDDEG